MATKKISTLVSEGKILATPDGDEYLYIYEPDGADDANKGLAIKLDVLTALLYESGGTLLNIGAIADGQVLKRDGTSIIGTSDTLVRYAVRAYRDATTFTLTTSGTLYTVPLNQESYDTHNQHSLITNPSRLTCVKAGMYLIHATITFSSNATGNRDALILKNGTTYIGNQRLQANSSGSTGVNTYAIVALEVGDYVEAQARQYSGGSLDLYYADDSNNQMTMVRLGV
jgi:hypothetical protein